MRFASTFLPISVAQAYFSIQLCIVKSEAAYYFFFLLALDDVVVLLPPACRLASGVQIQARNCSFMVEITRVDVASKIAANNIFLPGATKSSTPSFATL